MKIKCYDSFTLFINCDIDYSTITGATENLKFERCRGYSNSLRSCDCRVTMEFSKMTDTKFYNCQINYFDIDNSNIDELSMFENCSIETFKVSKSYVNKLSVRGGIKNYNFSNTLFENYKLPFKFLYFSIPGDNNETISVYYFIEDRSIKINNRLYKSTDELEHNRTYNMIKDIIYSYNVNNDKPVNAYEIT